jgi:ParB family chromosome partitioning protein
MAQKVVYERVPIAAHSTIRADEAAFPLYAFHDEGSLATETIGEQRQALDQSWAGYTTMSERFDAFRQLDEEARAAWIGFAIARTLEPTLNVTEGYRVNGFHDHLGRLLDIKVEEWWRPTAQNFFGRVKKDVILDALEEIGGTTLRARYKDAKKGDLANTAGALCEGKGIIEAEIRDKALAWLPDAMRFDGIEQPAKLLLLATEEEPDEDDDGFEDGGEDDGTDTDTGAGAGGDEDAGADEAPEDLDRAA